MLANAKISRYHTSHNRLAHPAHPLGSKGVLLLRWAGATRGGGQGTCPLPGLGGHERVGEIQQDISPFCEGGWKLWHGFGDSGKGLQTLGLGTRIQQGPAPAFDLL